MTPVGKGTVCVTSFTTMYIFRSPTIILGNCVNKRLVNISNNIVLAYGIHILIWIKFDGGFFWPYINQYKPKSMHCFLYRPPYIVWRVKFYTIRFSPNHAGVKSNKDRKLQFCNDPSFICRQVKFEDGRSTFRDIMHRNCVKFRMWSS